MAPEHGGISLLWHTCVLVHEPVFLIDDLLQYDMNMQVRLGRRSADLAGHASVLNQVLVELLHDAIHQVLLYVEETMTHRKVSPRTYYWQLSNR